MTNEDLISRQMALDLCERFNGCVPYSVLSSHDMLPSVDTEKTGQWIMKYDNIVNDYFYECDNCKRGFQQKYHYCPNCGAKMEVEE